MIKRDESSKTIDCETCAVSKMHCLMQKILAERVTKSYKILHFDIIIFKKRFDFDETFCIAYFIDEFTSFNWVFSLIDHQEKTLMSMFKSLINKCDKADLSIMSRIMIKKIRSEQKISIDTKLKDWVSDQNIEWDWSSKNILEQNDKSERFDVLLIEKARCIREFSKLSKDLYPECYLAVAHLLNRIFMTQLSWNSSLIRLQRLLKKSIRWELDYLKIFDCKTYVLLKKSDVSSRSEKMKARAFVDYLIDYDSINIFRIWNLEKDDVNDYRDAIFDENAYYDSYDKNKRHLIKKTERKNSMQFRTYSIKSAVNVDLLNNDEEWLKTSVRDRLVLKNRTMKERSIENSINEMMKKVKKSIQIDDDDLEQLSTSLESPFSQIILLRFGLTEDDRISRFHSEDAEDVAESSNVIVRRKDKKKKPQMSESDQLFAIGQTSLDVTEIQTDLKNQFRRNIESADLNEANILSDDQKRTRKLTSRYAQIVWENEDIKKFSSFHAAFMAGLVQSAYVNQSDQSNQLNFN